MAAANFSRDVPEMFYGPISNEDNQRLRPPIRPRRRLYFEIVRNDFNHYFNRMHPIVLNEHNRDRLNHMLNQFVDEVRGEIEAWSERGSGWVVDEILEAIINVAQYQPLNDGTYIPLPEKLKNKKAIINIRNRDNESLR